MNLIKSYIEEEKELLFGKPIPKGSFPWPIAVVIFSSVTTSIWFVTTNYASKEIKYASILIFFVMALILSVILLHMWKQEKYKEAAWLSFTYSIIIYIITLSLYFKSLIKQNTN